MSGGYFGYDQFILEHIASEIDELIEKNDSKEEDSFGNRIGREYPPDIIEKFDETRRILRRARAMVQRIDLLVSWDDGEDSFRRRWEEEGL